MGNKIHLGFPAPLLGMQSVRLQVLYDDGELLVLSKPQGVLVQAESWYPRCPVLIEAIRHQAQLGKPEFQRFSIPESGLWAVSDLDPECFGPVIFTRQREHAEELKSLLGSGEFTFKFRFLSRNAGDCSPVQCELPMTRHRHQKKMLISHTTGKKSFTSFDRIGEMGSMQIWQGESHFPRRHQILLHAFEKAIPVLGDEMYAREKPLFLSNYKRNYQAKRNRDERPLYDGPAYYLQEIVLPGGDSIICPEPPKWKALLNQLGRILH